MISLRIRRHGATEWTYLSLSGEEEDYLCSLFGGKAYSQNFIVEVEDEGEWVVFEDYDPEEE